MTNTLYELERLHAESTKYPGYVVTRDGRVYSTTTNWRGKGVRELATHLTRDGYPLVTIGGKNVRVHRLVIEAFHGPQPSSEHQTRHLNGDKTDNRADNLAWGTAKENAADRAAHGRTASGDRSGLRRHPESRLTGSRNPFAKLSDDDAAFIRANYKSEPRKYCNARELAARFGVSADAVRAIAKGRRYRAKLNGGK